jgi:hypothetical protein
MSDDSLLVVRLLNLLTVGFLACAISWFAVPAFAELSQAGSGPILGMPVVPEEGPIVRVLVGKLTSLPIGLTPGQARLELNIVLRQTTGLLDLLYVLMVRRGRLGERGGGAGARYLARPDRHAVDRLGDPPGQDARVDLEDP